VKSFNFISLRRAARRERHGAKRRWYRWVGGFGVLVLTIGFVVPFVYIRFLRPTPPPPFSFDDLPEEAKPGSGPSAVSLPAEWSGVQPSSGGYAVVGRKAGKSRRMSGVTTITSGTFTQLNGVIQQIEVDFDLESVGSDDPARDRLFRSTVTQAGEYPVASFVLEPALSIRSRQGRITTPGLLLIAGTEQTVDVDLSFRWIRNYLEVVGTTDFAWQRWGIPDPFAGANLVGSPLLEFAVTFVPTPREHPVSKQG
jgi:polyisoprenoid-binding protein YceI